MGLTLRTLGRLLLSAATSAVLVALATLGMAVTTADRWLSLLVEPLSLLFLPGIFVALAWAGIAGHLHHHVKTVAENHDFSTAFVTWCTFGFYLVAAYRMLGRRRRRVVQTRIPGSR